MLFDDLAAASEDVAAVRSRVRKVERLAAVLSSVLPDEARPAVAYLSGALPHAAIGVGWASLRDIPDPPAERPTFGVLDVDAALREIGSLSGPGSQRARRAVLSDLFARATERERRFLIGLLTGEIRQGALEGVMVEAVARAAGVAASDVRRATMLAGDLGTVAAAALARGAAGLSGFALRVLEPVQPMLAQSATDVGDAMTRIHPAAVEWKLDGARLQVHRMGDEVRAFTRNLADVTARVPEVVGKILSLPVEAIVLDGEAIALRADGRPHPFQVTMGRFGTRRLADVQREELPLASFFFDCLHLDGRDLLDRHAHERFAALDRSLPDSLRIPRAVAARETDAARVLDDAISRGHEGVMVKALDAPYEAGRRGASWLKVKRAETLDLVVLAAEWGHGRRSGWLSNLHLGARDPSGGFVMLGKTFKGMTDEMLAWQTERLQQLEMHRDRYTVYVRPELVVEVAFDGVQASRRYPGGVALRFARVKGYRPDKRPAEADTIEAVRRIHDRGA
ncbi:MAG TPA: ATP-dependent DNA ligase [Actinomycetota bacterium]|nr:ATP-dependent DNA ligase [Actinomycetota bacterium]